MPTITGSSKKELLLPINKLAARVLDMKHNAGRLLRRFANANLSTTERFERIYSRNVWGGEEGEFYSGPGSDSEGTEFYVETVLAFIKEREDQIETIVDLGCGDFRVGRRLMHQGTKYIGIDIVASLVDHLNHAFGSDTCSFVCVDAITQELPEGDLCFVRQVLQHLSNDQIQSILQKTRKFKYVIVTEHLPDPNLLKSFNKDKPSGYDIRVCEHSGVFLDKEPFGLMNVQKLFEVPAKDYVYSPRETFATFLIQNEN